MTRLPLIALALLGLHASAASQTLNIQGGVQIELLIDPVFVPTATSESARIRWNRVSSLSKVTVSTFAPGQRFNLSVEAVDPRQATSMGEIALIDGAPAMDIVRDIEIRVAGHSNLRYMTHVTATEGYGQDVHTITYTLTVQ